MKYLTSWLRTLEMALFPLIKSSAGFVHVQDGEDGIYGWNPLGSIVHHEHARTLRVNFETLDRGLWRHHFQTQVRYSL